MFEVQVKSFGTILQIISVFYSINYNDDLVKSHEFNYRWLSKKVHIQGVVFFQERGHTCSMPSV